MGDICPTEPVLDREAALNRLGGDTQLFAELAGFVLEDAPLLFAEIARAVVANDAEAVRSRAHALKGLVAGCGGIRTANVAQQLENAGQACDLGSSPTLLRLLRTELDQLAQALRNQQQGRQDWRDSAS
jgi:HPt (histidine-containing phosphotransfer) domain-containing protein